MVVNGELAVNFASNGYLGLSTHPDVIAAMCREAARTGTSSTASRVVGGNLSSTSALERALASLEGREDAVVFSSGYHANTAVLGALGRLVPNCVVVSDALNHASIVDGCRLAKCTVAVYDHLDVEHVQSILHHLGDVPAVVVTESRFSMDGDVADLAALSAVCDRHSAMFIVDEAHSTGVDGQGRGLVHTLGLGDHVDLIVGTLGKALGVHGAFVAGDRVAIRWLENAARPFLYTTALPGPIAAAALAALEVLDRERPFEGLWRNIHALHDALNERGLMHHLGSAAPGPIVPIVVGSPQRAVALQRGLARRGLLAVAIRPPTVPDGTSRVRISIRADHTAQHIERLADALAEALDELDD